MNIKKLFLDKQGVHQLGNKKVKIKKVTPYVYKEVMNSVEMLPGILFDAMLKFYSGEEKKNVFEWILVAGDFVMDEIVKVTSILSGIDEEYIKKNVGIDEMVDYLFKTVKKNNLDETIKNMLSPLLKQIKPQETPNE
ncbi:hypothetical protein V7138_14930 [Bacillus sp. JJ1533]|uniref:hypothetical protein n=1 Tax=Bacillus sp. JJ1533 TaxID=3122959 RepID=UPI002FFEB31A